ncbi:putative spermidine/putrescine transport system ATP-binding protein [Desulfocicer vacuolatum DSM 3385]|uniref:Putative spermidine/putrescine transport system ATP-binding protein n=1 Tax=Desulfocicer vacuolatum DSM 3385 TaxID=1121400 RepID=A0A1W2B6D7_9BACT|nr:ABC transporter ATP-binding protein [Desulfocicer vacuolatum]SMC68496.1 putative spermidine/putrescine transport system ATP-binding protein [Desulfocicer vacuolatum DSM 3385]
MFFKVTQLNKSFGDKKLLKNISFTADRGDIISFVGPSGVGKTTLLKIIAGLEQPDSGDISFASGHNDKNPAVMVFQNFMLFPNMTVYDNIAFGLRAAKTGKKLIDEKVCEMLDCFQIRDKKEQYPRALSAGQQQRVAIARAMVIAPSVLLLDEPFANLDKNLKAETASFIHNTQKKFGTTTIAVMHDQEEAFRMSDKIGVMLDGKLVQFDTVDRIYHAPISIKAASFLGQVNMLCPKAVDKIFIKEPLDFTTHQYYFRAEAATISCNPRGEWKIMEIIFFGANISYYIKNDNLGFYVNSLDSHFKKGDVVDLAINKILKESLH